MSTANISSTTIPSSIENPATTTTAAETADPPTLFSDDGQDDDFRAEIQLTQSRRSKRTPKPIRPFIPEESTSRKRKTLASKKGKEG